MIEELNNKYLEIKGVIDVLPVNTKYNRKKKIDYITEEEENDKERINLVKKEIETRISQFDNLSINPEIEEITNDFEKCNIVNEWNQYNTSYEKMHLDYYLYQLHRYYKNDLESVNDCIRKILNSFKKVSIELTKDDFDFSNYASLYMDKIINNASSEELKDCFESVYWKNSDIIKIIEINFKSIYLRNEKKINAYYTARHNEFLKSHSDEEIYKLRIDLSNRLKFLKGNDLFLNFKKFENNEYSISDYNEDQIAKRRNLYFPEGVYNVTSLLDLYNVLNEYNILIKYKYLFNDMKEKLEKKDSLKNSKNIALKEIIKEENNLRKINSKQNKKGLFGRIRDDEKLLFEYRKSLDNTINYYDNFDEACFNDLVFNKLFLDSSILEILKLICSNYTYFVNKTYELDENRDINDITDEFEKLKNYVYSNDFIVLNNIALLDEKQMKELIVNKYNLNHIDIALDNLKEENISTTIGDFEILINYENIISSGIDIENLSLYLDYKKLINQ